MKILCQATSKSVKSRAFPSVIRSIINSDSIMPVGEIRITKAAKRKAHVNTQRSNTFAVYFQIRHLFEIIVLAR